MNAPGADAYSISTATWLLTYREIGDRAKGLAIIRMLWWATHEGQRFSNDLAYAMLPPELTFRSEEFIKEITSRDGLSSRPNKGHVLLISVDGLHEFDLEQWISTRPDSELAKLRRAGTTFTNAATTSPSDSVPGLLFEP